MYLAKEPCDMKQRRSPNSFAAGSYGTVVGPIAESPQGWRRTQSFAHG